MRNVSPVVIILLAMVMPGAAVAAQESTVVMGQVTTALDGLSVPGVLRDGAAAQFGSDAIAGVMRSGQSAGSRGRVLRVVRTFNVVPWLPG